MSDQHSLEVLKKRLNPQGQPATRESEPPPTSTRGGKPGPIPVREDRRRHTLFFGTPEKDALDSAYRKMEHDLYPLVLEKAEYLEMCMTYLCEPYQQEQIGKRLRDKLNPSNK